MQSGLCEEADEARQIRSDYMNNLAKFDMSDVQKQCAEERYVVALYEGFMDHVKHVIENGNSEPDPLETEMQ